MIREEKFRLEKLYGIEFLNQYDPELLLLSKKDESPDYIFPTKMLGLEITQISNFLKNGISRMQLEGSWDSLIRALEVKWNKKELPGCFIAFSFDHNIHIPKKKLEKVCNDIIEFLVNFIPEPQGIYSSVDSEIIMPKYVQSFSIERIVNYEKAIFCYNDAIFSPDLKINVVQKAIDKKENYREKYLQKCKIIWLLIVAYGGRSSGEFIMKEEVLNHKYLSDFDKVFLFDAIPKKYWELNIQKSA